MEPDRTGSYWKKNITLILILLGIWALVSLVFGILMVETLNEITFFKVPLGFWFAQQGSIYVFVILIFVYAWRLGKLDRDHDVQE